MPPPLLRSSLRDSALAGHDGVEGLAGLGKNAKNGIGLTDEEPQSSRPQPCTLEAAWTARLVVIAGSQAWGRARPGYGIDRSSEPPYNAQARSRGDAYLYGHDAVTCT